MICVTKGENLERKDSNLKDLRNTCTEVNNIKRCMIKAKEDWIGEHCSEIEENLRKNNSIRAHQLMKGLTTAKQGTATTIQECSGKCLTEEQEILNGWMEYCSKKCNHKTTRDPSVLNCPQTDTEDNHTILHKEVETAEQSLKKGKLAGVVNILAELVQEGGEAVNFCSHNLHKDLADRRLVNPMDPLPGHHTSKERQPAAVPELPNVTTASSEQTEATSDEDHH